MKELIKIKRCFCSHKFQKLSKDIDTIKRLDKINIFEYFDIIQERKISKPQEFLVKEISDYINSNIFHNEFKFTLSSEDKKFKFLLMNLGLLTNKLQIIYNEEKRNFNFLKILSFDFKTFFLIKKLLVLFKFFPFKFYCLEVLKIYLNRNQIKFKYNYIVENELLKIFNKKDFSYLKTKRNFIETLSTIDNEEELLKIIKERFVRDFLLNDKFLEKNTKEKKRQETNEHLNENDCEKLTLFFIAHVKFYFFIFNFSEKLSRKFKFRRYFKL